MINGLFTQFTLGKINMYVHTGERHTVALARLNKSAESAETIAKKRACREREKDWD